MMETRLGRIRGYDPTAEQAFSRQQPGVNPIALELDRLAQLRGLPRHDLEPRNAQGQTQGEERDQLQERDDAFNAAVNGGFEKWLEAPPDDADPKARMTPEERRQYALDAYNNMTPGEQALFDRLDRRQEEQSIAVGNFADTRPGFRTEGDNIFGDDVSPEDEETMNRMMDKRDRTIQRLGRLQDRAHGRTGVPQGGQ